MYLRWNITFLHALKEPTASMISMYNFSSLKYQGLAELYLSNPFLSFASQIKRHISSFMPFPVSEVTMISFSASL